MPLCIIMIMQGRWVGHSPTYVRGGGRGPTSRQRCYGIYVSCVCHQGCATSRPATLRAIAAGTLLAGAVSDFHCLASDFRCLRFLLAWSVSGQGVNLSGAGIGPDSDFARSDSDFARVKLTFKPPPFKPPNFQTFKTSNLQTFKHVRKSNV